MVDYMPLLGTPLRTVAKIEGYFFFRIMGIVKMSLLPNGSCFQRTIFFYIWPLYGAMIVHIGRIKTSWLIFVKPQPQ